MTDGRLTLFYIVEPPQLEVMACTLLASIRTFFPEGTQAIGYCPAHRMGEIHPAVIRAHEMMGAEIRPFEATGRFDPAYPHGNKILACLEPRDTEFSAFVDSDVIFLRPNSVEALAAPGHVSCSVAASMRWGEDTVWEGIYGAFGMAVPEERVNLMRRGVNRVPYFSSGFVIFPEASGFADIWYDTAQTIDRIEGLESKRPYLDQMSLPIAIRRAGLNWRELTEEQHYILGGKHKGQRLAEDREIFTVHYRNLDHLRHAGLRDTAKDILRQQVGVPYVSRLVKE